jgi:hypothetical protein
VTGGSEDEKQACVRENVRKIVFFLLFIFSRHRELIINRVMTFLLLLLLL